MYTGVLGDMAAQLGAFQLGGLGAEVDMPSYMVKDKVLLTVVGNPGTGAVTVGAAIAGYQLPSSADDGNTYDIMIQAVDGNGTPTGLWEVQLGSTWLYSPGTFSRSAINVLDGSSGPGVLVNFASGTQRIAIVAPSARVRFNPMVNDLRLSLSATLAVTVADLVGIQAVYIRPQTGLLIALPFGGWVSPFHFSQLVPDYILRMGDARSSGTFTTGSKVVTGLTDTSQWARGMKVTATGLAAGNTIASIDSKTQITLANLPISNQTGVVLSVFAPAGAAYDVFAVALSPTTWRIQFGNAWTTPSGVGGATPARADLLVNDGTVPFLVNAAAINAADYNGIPAKAGRYLGTVYASGDGATEDSLLNRYLWNFYNRQMRPLRWQDFGTANWTYALTAWRQAGGNAAYKVSAVVGWADSPVHLVYTSGLSPTSSTSCNFGIGRDISTAIAGFQVGGSTAVLTGAYVFTTVTMDDIGYLAGHHTWYPLEMLQGNSSVLIQNITISGQANGMIGFLMG